VDVDGDDPINARRRPRQDGQVGIIGQPLDRGGRYIYVKDSASKDFWSVSWQPVLKDASVYKYECRHGLGYSVIKSEYAGISTETTYLVPKAENLEIWCCVIRNQSQQSRTLEIYPFIEFCLYDALNDMTDYQYNYSIGTTEFDAGTSTIYHTTEHNIKRDIFTYFTVNHKVSGFDSQRSDFLGVYGDFSAPRAVTESQCHQSLSVGWSPVGAFKIDLTLKPGEAQTVDMERVEHSLWERSRHPREASNYGAPAGSV
jgi:cellobiose phosphorylase